MRLSSNSGRCVERPSSDLSPAAPTSLGLEEERKSDLDRIRTGQLEVGNGLVLFRSTDRSDLDLARLIAFVGEQLAVAIGAAQRYARGRVSALIILLVSQVTR